MPWVEVKSWRPHVGPQTEVLQRREKEILYGGARGGGKTEAGLAWLIEPEYVENPMYRALVLRQDYDDLEDWVFRAKQFYRGLGEVVGNPPRIRWRWGGVVRLGHWKDKTTISKYIGQEYQKMLLEELTQTVGSLKEYKMIQGSCRSTMAELPAQLMGTTNPGGPGHAWVKEYFVEKCRNKTYIDPETGYSRIFIPSKVTDNPTLVKNDPQYVKWLDGLPSELRSMWRDGSWDSFQGQFFSRVGTKERPWHIGRERSLGHLFGSLDIGISHFTSFGLWYLDTKGFCHRLFTYKANGSTHRDHAMSIKDRIETFRWTEGVFPVQVWVGHDAWTKTRLREDFVLSPINEYEDVFRGKGTRFVRANIDRENGCVQMREAFSERDGVAQMSFWADYNKSYEEDMLSMMVDENHPETYAKVDGDDTPDECRYGIVGLRSWVANEQSIQQARQSRQRLPVRNDMEDEYKSMMHETSLA